MFLQESQNKENEPDGAVLISDLLLSKIEKLFHIITKSFVLVITLSFSDGSIKLNNASQLLLPDIEAENGVVHVIDQALSPPPETGFLIGVGK